MQAYASWHLHPAFWLHNPLPWTRGKQWSPNWSKKLTRLHMLHRTTTEVIYCHDKTRPGRLLHTLPESDISPNVTLNYRYQDITTDAITFIYSCYFIYFRVFYVHMLSHALIIMLTLLCLIYIYDIATREISAIWWVGTHHTRKVLYACDRLGTLLSLVTVFFISYGTVCLFHLYVI
jgi:hypothetical protein